jgi:hypothetical protein
MTMYSENGFRKILKNWAAEYQPPDDGRAKLLSQAAVVQKRKRDLSFLIPRTQFNDYPIHSPNEWSQSLFSFFFAQSLHASVQGRL